MNIEDLLPRDPIIIENERVRKVHKNQSILVTGGAGSIGKEIVQLIAEFQPSILVVLDQAETPLYNLELELKERFPNIHFKFILANISDLPTLKSIFLEHSFSFIYHAAAYKHVPILEENPHEGIIVNIEGTRNLVQLSFEHNVDRFVMISTDKAVNPTSVMGATKRIAEILTQSFQHKVNNRTKFIITRFGNVLGSSGSIIPRFQQQIKQGGPVTITHPEMTRYFMTITEACELVLQAATMGNGGEVYIFDMGEPIKIMDLVRKMINLIYPKGGSDIEIITTGIRPGEKLQEELFSRGTRSLPTHHEKILISEDLKTSFESIKILELLIDAARSRKDRNMILKLLKEIVPEFMVNSIS